MSRYPWYMLLSFLCFWYPASAQHARHAQHTTKAIAKAPIPVKPTFSNEAFDGVIPPHFMGNDLRGILAGLTGGSRDKGEFETTSQYDARMKAVVNAPLYGGIPRSAKLAFVFPINAIMGQMIDLGFFEICLTYNADVGAYTYTIRPDAQSPLSTRKQPKDAEGYRSLIWDRMTDSNEYVGTNGFGATVHVTRIHEKNVALSFHMPLGSDVGLNDTDKLMGHHSFAPFTFAVAQDKAEALKAHIRMLLVCTMVQEGDPVRDGNDVSEATFQDPTDLFSETTYLRVKPLELWSFDEETGTVLGKLVFPVPAWFLPQ